MLCTCVESQPAFTDDESHLPFADDNVAEHRRGQGALMTMPMLMHSHSDMLISNVGGLCLRCREGRRKGR